MTDRDLTRWLHTAILTTRALARDAADGPWTGGTESDHGWHVLDSSGAEVAISVALPTMAHIVTNNPQVVLDRCAADLELLDEHRAIDGYCRTCSQTERQPDPVGWFVPAPCRTIRLIGTAYRHTIGGWRGEWRTG